MDSLENTFTTTDSTDPPPSPVSQEPTVLIENLNITDENVALNVLISFVGVAQKRGVFNLQEAAKLWECVQMFMKKTPVEKKTE